MDLAGTTIFAVYVQVNTENGFEFWDKKGLIARHWSAEFPNIRLRSDEDKPALGLILDPRGPKTDNLLTMVNPDSRIREFRVDDSRVWIHFDEPETLRVCELIAETASEPASSRSKVSLQNQNCRLIHKL